MANFTNNTIKRFVLDANSLKTVIKYNLEAIEMDTEIYFDILAASFYEGVRPSSH